MTPENPDYTPGAASIWACHARAHELAAKVTRHYRISGPGGTWEAWLTDAEVQELKSKGVEVEALQ